MANTFVRSLALVGAVAFIPATAASLAQTDVNSYRELDQFMATTIRAPLAGRLSWKSGCMIGAR